MNTNDSLDSQAESNKLSSSPTNGFFEGLFQLDAPVEMIREGLLKWRQTMPLSSPAPLI